MLSIQHNLKAHAVHSLVRAHRLSNLRLPTVERLQYHRRGKPYTNPLSTYETWSKLSESVLQVQIRWHVVIPHCNYFTINLCHLNYKSPIVYISPLWCHHHLFDVNFDLAENLPI